MAEYKPQEEEMYYYTPDQINSTRIVTDSTGTVVYSAAHDPYGGMQKTWVNTYDPTPKFSGKERDAESGLDYFGARYYDKGLYRFISVDPVITMQPSLFDPQLWNRYTYCSNNPGKYADLTGKYGKNFHFNTMVYLALKAGFSKEDALTIAEFCQAVDEFSNTKAGLGKKSNELWHWVDDDTLRAMESMAVERGDLALIGMVGHAIGDSEGAHDGVTDSFSSGLAHVFGCDSTSTDVAKTLVAEQRILDFLLECNNKEPGTMTIDTALCAQAAKKDTDPITELLKAVAGALHWIGPLMF